MAKQMKIDCIVSNGIVAH